ncbi:MAG TPA: LysE family translocator [Chloroflexia bacterium]|nr:LysE family translocator [Chloroflexia bacterium]
MPQYQTLILFLAATLALNLTPGPDMLYVIARGVEQGRKAGVVSALGIGGGTLVHTIAVAAGLSTLLTSVPALYDAVRYAGAFYLLYLGVRTLLGRGQPELKSSLPTRNLGRIFVQGVTTNVLNPKVALFFIAFLPQFADPARGSVALQIVMLGLLFNLSGTTVNTIVGLLSGYLGSRLRQGSRLWRAQRWFTGGVFVLLAARLALPDRR